jgi:hypothetical protein
MRLTLQDIAAAQGMLTVLKTGAGMDRAASEGRVLLLDTLSLGAAWLEAAMTVSRAEKIFFQATVMLQTWAVQW